jgi:hypothetical protein
MRYAVRACILKNNFDGYLDQLIAACSQAKQNYRAVAQKEGVLP